ncbi:hypothetical protein [Photobacterium sp. TY1-4]|uniref:hypothetical protein n=1 Tax=Photobacterium sp. TY1-4 TaxID=2899122 RepID=UPI0021BF2BBA|nr:hypothetical protein [Photobacterium sp. TY1-4]UXI04165.1 hypothetical protein NH461_18870 [Photobacterium sp. TY1-4]
MAERILIADTKTILDAFIENGLHHDYAIYCQFPHCDKTVIELHHHHPRSVEFNDGYQLTAGLASSATHSK